MESICSHLVLFGAYISYSDDQIHSSIKVIFETYNFQGDSGLLQFWEWNTIGDSDDIRCSLTLAEHICVANIHDNRLDEYRMRCFLKNPFIGQETNVGNWFVGRATQTGVADHRTRSVMLYQDDEAAGMGQLVVPVYYNYPGARLKFVGIIELVTTQPKECYVADFNQIQRLLMTMNLTSTYMGKMIKVQVNNHMVKFTLPFLAKLQDLQKQVTMRFKKLENTTFCIKYEDSNLNRHSISSDQALEFCIAESISNRTTVIRMYVEKVEG